MDEKEIEIEKDEYYEERQSYYEEKRSRQKRVKSLEYYASNAFGLFFLIEILTGIFYVSFAKPDTVEVVSSISTVFIHLSIIIPIIYLIMNTANIVRAIKAKKYLKEKTVNYK